jgi:hypothetical protein
MDERPKPSSPVLVKEVAPPLPRQSGLGVLVVASMAMLFAVSSAAFLVRARMDSAPCPRADSRASPADTGPAAAEPGAPCGEAAYVKHPDGTLTVTFDLCDAGAARAPVARPEGIEVRAVHR